MSNQKTVQVRVRLASSVVGAAAQVALTSEEHEAVRNTAITYGFGSERGVSTFIRRCGELAAGPSEGYPDVHSLLTAAASRSGLSLGAWLRVCVLVACGVSELSYQLDILGTARCEGRLKA